MLLKLALIASLALEAFALKNLVATPWALRAAAPLTVTWEGESGDGDTVQLSFVHVGAFPERTRTPTGVSLGNGTYDISAKTATAPIPDAIEAKGNRYTIQAFVLATNKSIESNIFEVTSGQQLTMITSNGMTFAQVESTSVAVTDTASITTTVTGPPSQTTQVFTIETIDPNSSATSSETSSSTSSATSSSTGSTSASPASSSSPTSSSGERVFVWSRANWAAVVVTLGFLYTS